MIHRKINISKFPLQLSIVYIAVLALTGCSQVQGTAETTTSITAAPKPLFSVNSLLPVVCEELPEQLDRVNWVCGYEDGNQDKQLNLFVAETEDEFLREKKSVIQNFSQVDPALKDWLEATTFCGQGWILKAHGPLLKTSLAEKTYKKLIEAKISATRC
jgi:hypothetical protein